MTVRLGDDYRRTPAPRSDFGPPDPAPGSCEECGASPWTSRHAPDCPFNPFNPEGGYES